ncbi:MAG: hypothetical protein AAF587_21315 [Bacteroidota bacterium]
MKTFPSWVWLVFASLFALSIPWYLPPDLSMMLVAGLPLWLLSCILAIVGMAFFSLLIIRIYWEEEDEEVIHPQQQVE